MKKSLLVIMSIASLIAIGISSCGKEAPAPKPSVYDFKIRNITTSPIQPVDLSQYKGKVMLIVNTATECGYTPQYSKLQDLYIKYNAKGLEILAFPSNSFNQEPRPEEEIVKFCQDNFRVSFPMFIKIEVKGPEIHPLYKYLTDAATDPKFAGEVKWNFEKFLVSKTGEVIGRFDSKTEPDDPSVISAIEQALAQ